MKQMKMKITATGASHRGNIRGHNEDNIYVDGAYRNDLSMDNVLISSRRTSGPYTYAVFDGLGGEACGEQASLIAALGLKAIEDRGHIKDIDYTAADREFSGILNLISGSFISHGSKQYCCRFLFKSSAFFYLEYMILYDFKRKTRLHQCIEGSYYGHLLTCKKCP